MKIIDVLNKIADGSLNDEFVIEHDKMYYKYDEVSRTLKGEDDCSISEHDNLESCLNDDVKVYKEIKEFG